MHYYLFTILLSLGHPLTAVSYTMYPTVYGSKDACEIAGQKLIDLLNSAPPVIAFQPYGVPTKHVYACAPV